MFQCLTPAVDPVVDEEEEAVVVDEVLVEDEELLDFDEKLAEVREDFDTADIALGPCVCRC